MTAPAIASRKLTYTKAFGTVRTLGALLKPPGLEWVTELPREAPHSPIVLHISCNAHLTLFIPFIAQEALRRLGKDFVVLGGPENCCGFMQVTMGDADLEPEAARKALLGFNRASPQLLVSVCPDCDEVFEKFRLPTTRFEIVNISDLFVRYLPELRPLLRPVKKRVVVHYHAVNESRQKDTRNIRMLLEAIPGLDILPAAKHLGPGIHCQTVAPMPPADQEAMFAEAHALGADVLVVPYHSCYRQHVKAELQYPMAVQHYTGLLAESLGIDYTEPFKELRLLDDVDAVMNTLRPRLEGNVYDEPTIRTFVERAIFCR
jgi:hypothetical protein